MLFGRKIALWGAYESTACWWARRGPWLGWAQHAMAHICTLLQTWCLPFVCFHQQPLAQATCTLTYPLLLHLQCATTALSRAVMEAGSNVDVKALGNLGNALLARVRT